MHVHIYYNEGKNRRLLGRYRLPGLEPIFPVKEPELSKRETEFLKSWIAKPEQQKKLQKFLEETLFDMHKIGNLAKIYGQILTDESGNTFITIRVPVSERIK